MEENAAEAQVVGTRRGLTRSTVIVRQFGSLAGGGPAAWLYRTTFARDVSEPAVSATFGTCAGAQIAAEAFMSGSSPGEACDMGWKHDRWAAIEARVQS